MAVTFTNNWKNILDALEGILEDEFKGTLPVCVGDEPMHGSQYIRVRPINSSLISYTNTSEEREFNISVIYYFDEKFLKTKNLEHRLRFTSRIEALVHDNFIITLSDSSKAVNCRVAETKIVCGASDSNSSNFNGRLSNADGKRNPNSTSVSFLERSPLYIAPI